MENEEIFKCLCDSSFELKILRIIQQSNFPINFQDVIIITNALLNKDENLDLNLDYNSLFIYVKRILDSLVKYKKQIELEEGKGKINYYVELNENQFNTFDFLGLLLDNQNKTFKEKEIKISFDQSKFQKINEMQIIYECNCEEKLKKELKISKNQQNENKNNINIHKNKENFEFIENKIELNDFNSVNRSFILNKCNEIDLDLKKDNKKQIKSDKQITKENSNQLQPITEENKNYKDEQKYILDNKPKKKNSTELFKKPDKLYNTNIQEFEQEKLIDEILINKKSLEKLKKDYKNNKYMNEIHNYNEIKDTAQEILGYLAHLKNLTVKELYEDYGISDDEKKFI